MEFTLVAAAGTGVVAMWLVARVAGERIGVDRPGDILLSAAMAGLLVGRLAAMVGAGTNPITRPADIIIVRGGVDTVWASIGAVGAVLWMTRRSLPATADRLAPVGLVGLAGWHAGCLWRGACVGTATELPWALATEGSSAGRHPVELYTAALLLLGAWAVSRLEAPWGATGGAIAAAGLARLVTQPLRLSVVGGPVWFYVAALVVGVVLAVLGRRLQRLIRTRPPGPSTMAM